MNFGRDNLSIFEFASPVETIKSKLSLMGDNLTTFKNAPLLINSRLSRVFSGL